MAMTTAVAKMGWRMPNGRSDRDRRAVNAGDEWIDDEEWAHGTIEMASVGKDVAACSPVRHGPEAWCSKRDIVMRDTRCEVLVAIACCATFAVASCGSDDTRQEGSIDPACTKYASARCAALERCAGTLLRIDYGTRDACERQVHDLCINTASLPGASIAPSAVSSCADALASATCDQVQASLDRPFCEAVGGGTLSDGAPCSSGYQCSSRACFRAAGSVCGTCQPPVGVGGGCRSSVDCPNGTTCTGYVCLPASGVGGPCDGTHGCAGYLMCSNGVCTPSPAEGSACGPACSNKLGLDCDGSTQTCQPIPIAADGEACGLNVACEAHGACVQSVCRSAVAAGHPCDSQAGPFCQQPAECIDGWCKVPDGSTCP